MGYMMITHFGCCKHSLPDNDMLEHVTGLEMLQFLLCKASCPPSDFSEKICHMMTLRGCN